MNTMPEYVNIWWSTLGRLCFVLVICSIFIAPASARIGFFMAPPMIELAATPGGTARFGAQLTNTSTETREFRMFPEGLAQTREGKYDFKPLKDANQATSCAGWMEWEPKQVRLKPGESTIVKCTIKVPTSQRSGGGRYAGLVCQIVPTAGTGNDPAEVSLDLRTATIIYLTIQGRGGRSIPKAVVSNLKVEADPEKGVAFSASLQNTGGIHVFGQGRMVLRTSTGRRLAEIKLGSGRGAVLPGATVDYTTIVKKGIPVGDYIAEARISYGGYAPAIAKANFTIGRDAIMSAKGRGLAVEVDPGLAEFEVPAGGTRLSRLFITNMEDRPVHIKASIAALDQDTSGQFFVPEGDAVPLRTETSWVDLKTTEIDLNSGNRRQIVLAMAVPKDQAPGGYYSTLVLDVTAKDDDGSPITSQLICPLLTGVKGETTVSAKIQGIEGVLPKKDTTLTIAASLENTGTTHITPTQAVLTINTRPAGDAGPEVAKTVATVTLSDEQAVLLPGRTRIFVFHLAEDLPPGDYSASVRIIYGGKGPAAASYPFHLDPITEPPAGGEEPTPPGAPTEAPK